MHTGAIGRAEPAKRRTKPGPDVREGFILASASSPWVAEADCEACTVMQDGCGGRWVIEGWKDSEMSI